MPQGETPIWERALGILVFDEGVIIHAYPDGPDRTRIEVGGGIGGGSIVRDPETALWRYDDDMRSTLNIAEDPTFKSDADAGRDLEDYLPPLPELRASIIRKRRERDLRSVLEAMEAAAHSNCDSLFTLVDSRSVDMVTSRLTFARECPDGISDFEVEVSTFSIPAIIAKMRRAEKLDA